MLSMSQEEKAAQYLIAKRKTLSIAESLSGGLLSHRLTNIPGSSKFLKATLVVYSNESKQKLLKIKAEDLNKNGAVSEQVAIAMAKNVRKLFDTDFGIGITGIAGPTGGTKRKPIGMTFIAVATKEELLCIQYQFFGERKDIKQSATTEALRLLNEFLY